MKKPNFKNWTLVRCEKNQNSDSGTSGTVIHENNTSSAGFFEAIFKDASKYVHDVSVEVDGRRYTLRVGQFDGDSEKNDKNKLLASCAIDIFEKLSIIEDEIKKPTSLIFSSATNASWNFSRSVSKRQIHDGSQYKILKDETNRLGEPPADLQLKIGKA